MQALHYIDTGELAWRETASPAISASDDALIRPMAVAACDLDRSIASSASPFPGPFVMGHEFCGIVEAVGDGVQSVTAGDTVIASFQPSCGTCKPCHGGRTSVCGNAGTTAMYGIGAAGGNWSGALAAQIRVPWADVNLRKLPPGVSAEAFASGSDNLADGLRAVDDALIREPGASVLVAGSGSIPLYAVLCAAHLGAGTISFASDDHFALEVAESLGAECLPVTQWPKKFQTHDITFDCTNLPEGLAAVIRSTAPFGLCTSASIYFADTTPVPLRDMYMKGIEFQTGRVNSAAQLDRVLELAVQGINPDRIQPLKVPFADAVEALQTAPRSQKVIMTQPAS